MVNDVTGVPPVPTTLGTISIPLSTREQVAVQVISVDPKLNSITNQTQLRGQIIDAKPDGRVVIRTDRGDVTAQLPRNVSANTGQSISIDLAAGQPPRQAQIVALPPEGKAAPTPPQTTTGNTAPQTPQPVDPAATVPTNPVPANLSGTPIRDIANTRPPSGSPSPSTPEIDQVVQIKAVTLAQAQQLAKDAPQTLQKVLLDMMGAQNNTASSATPAAALKTMLAGMIPAGQGVTVPPGMSVALNIIATPRPVFMATPTLAAPTGIATPPVIGPQGMMPPALPADQMPPSPPVFTNLSNTAAMPTLEARVMMIDLAPGMVLSAPTASDGMTPSPQTTLLPATLTPTADGYSAVTQPFTVFGTTIQGNAIIQSAFTPLPNTSGLFILQAPSDGLPVGSNIHLQFLQNVTATPVTPTQSLASPLSLTGLSVPLLDAIDQLLQALPPQIAADVFGSTARPPVPNVTQAPQQLGAAALLFLAAVRSGDVQSWLGERAVDALKHAGKAGLIEQLDDTFGNLRRASADAGGGDWKSYLLPMQLQNEIMPIRMHMRNDRDADGKQDGKNASRYILEVDFDRMGAVQLDLLYRPQQLDTILRTELPMSRAMMGTLERKYAGAMQNVGHAGELHFQHGIKNWVMIDAPLENMQFLA